LLLERKFEKILLVGKFLPFLYCFVNVFTSLTTFVNSLNCSGVELSHDSILLNFWKKDLISETTGGTESKYFAATRGREEVAKFLKPSGNFEIVSLRVLILGREFVIARRVLKKVVLKIGLSQ
jgi:hypothetical protein